jgi:hypothetical protein
MAKGAKKGGGATGGDPTGLGAGNATSKGGGGLPTHGVTGADPIGPAAINAAFSPPAYNQLSQFYPAGTDLKSPMTQTPFWQGQMGAGTPPSAPPPTPGPGPKLPPGLTAGGATAPNGPALGNGLRAGLATAPANQQMQKLMAMLSGGRVSG